MVEHVTRSAAGPSCHGARTNILSLARSRNARTAATLLSLRAYEGKPLGFVERKELAAHRERSRRYCELASDLTNAGFDITTLKGDKIQAFYPPGVIREASDIDIAVKDGETFWTLNRHLETLGWDQRAITFVYGEDRLHFAAGMRREAHTGGPFPFDYIDLSTYALYGNGWSVGPRTPWKWGRLDAVPLLLSILDEAFQQRLRARDLIDAAILSHQLSGDGTSAILAEVDHARLSPELHRLLRSLTVHGLSPYCKPFGKPYPSRLPRFQERWSRLRRYPQLVRQPRQIVGLAARQRAFHNQDWPLQLLQLLPLTRHYDPHSFLTAGLPLYGLRVSRKHSHGVSFTPLSCPPTLLASTPGGVYACSADGLFDKATLEQHGLWSSDLQEGLKDSHDK